MGLHLPRAAKREHGLFRSAVSLQYHGRNCQSLVCAILQAHASNLFVLEVLCLMGVGDVQSARHLSPADLCNDRLGLHGALYGCDGRTGDLPELSLPLDACHAPSSWKWVGR